MELTLRKAKQLQQQISDAIAECTKHYNVEVTEYDDPRKVVTAGADKLSATLEKASYLINVLYYIRQEMAKANNEAGINTYLTEAARIDMQILNVGGILHAPVQCSEAEIIGTHTKLRESKSDNDYGHYTKKFMVSVITEQDKENVKDILKQYKKEKVAIQDRILELNVVTKIELLEADVAALKKFGIL